jgi:hypothetical protein
MHLRLLILVSFGRERDRALTRLNDPAATGQADQAEQNKGTGNFSASFVVSLSNHEWNPLKCFTLRLAQGERKM